MPGSTVGNLENASTEHLILRSTSLSTSGQTLTVSGSMGIYAPASNKTITVKFKGKIDGAHANNKGRYVWCEVAGAADRTISTELASLRTQATTDTHMNMYNVAVESSKYYSLAYHLPIEASAGNVYVSTVVVLEQ